MRNISLLIFRYLLNPLFIEIKTDNIQRGHHWRIKVKPGQQPFNTLSSERIFGPDKVVTVPCCYRLPEGQREKAAFQRVEREPEIRHRYAVSVHGRKAALLQGVEHDPAAHVEAGE